MFSFSQHSLRVTAHVSQAANGLTSKERTAFIGGALVETLFFLISSVGYVRGVHSLAITHWPLTQTHSLSVRTTAS